VESVLHPALPLLTWLAAAAGKGYALGAAHADGVLRLIAETAAVRERDYLPPRGQADATAATGGGGGGGGGAGAAWAAAEALPPAEAGLVRALLLRAAFGGMQGDVAMLRSYAQLWAARFAGSGPPPPALPLPGDAAVAAAAAAEGSGGGGMQAPPSQAFMSVADVARLKAEGRLCGGDADAVATASFAGGWPLPAAPAAAADAADGATCSPAAADAATASDEGRAAPSPVCASCSS
jgi:hypothetical protein